MADSDRRELTFANLNEVVADIEAIANSAHRTSGKQTFAQIVQHLATTNEMLVGKIVPPKLPWYMRMMMPLMRNKILDGPVKPGFKLPSADLQSFFWDGDDTDLQQAIDNFKASVKAYYVQGPLDTHPIFGKASREQIDRITLAHAAMHLSFVHPE